MRHLWARLWDGIKGGVGGFGRNSKESLGKWIGFMGSFRGFMGMGSRAILLAGSDLQQREKNTK